MRRRGAGLWQSSSHRESCECQNMWLIPHNPPYKIYHKSYSLASVFFYIRVHVEVFGKTGRKAKRNSTRIRRMLRINTDFLRRPHELRSHTIMKIQISHRISQISTEFTGSADILSAKNADKTGWQPRSTLPAF